MEVYGSGDANVTKIQITKQLPKCLLKHSNHNFDILTKENNQGTVCNLMNT